MNFGPVLLSGRCRRGGWMPPSAEFRISETRAPVSSSSRITATAIRRSRPRPRRGRRRGDGTPPAKGIAPSARRVARRPPARVGASRPMPQLFGVLQHRGQHRKRPVEHATAGAHAHRASAAHRPAESDRAARWPKTGLSCRSICRWLVGWVLASNAAHCRPRRPRHTRRSSAPPP